MSGWTIPEFLDGLKVKLDADATLSALDPSVSTYTGEPSIQAITTDLIVLGYDGSDDDEDVALGGTTRDERQNVNCYVQVMRPGAGEDTIKEARDGAASILRAIDSVLRTDPPTVGTTAYAMGIANREFNQFPTEVGESNTPVRVCVVQFAIQYRARTSV